MENVLKLIIMFMTTASFVVLRQHVRFVDILIELQDDSIEQQSLKSLTWSRVLLEKLIVTQLVKKYPTFDGTRSFITVFTTARHRSD
jgi:hypothetical protein